MARWIAGATRGRVRAQFTHYIDIAPTVLEAAGIPEPKQVDGIEQEPMDGTSFLHIFNHPNAEERHTVQYFEFAGGRAIYKDGWWACAKLDRKPWDFTPETMQKFAPGVYDPEKDTWELYYLPDDFSQAHDIAAQHPDKLKELKEVFWAEAERNRVLPLMGAMSVFFGILPPLPTITRFTFSGDVQNVQRGMVPRVFGRSYAIEAGLEISESGAGWVVVANADFIGGFALWVDEQRIGEGTMPRTVPVAFSTYAGMDISRDNGGVVDLDYEAKAPYQFTGTVKQVVFDLKPAAVHKHEQALHEHASINAVAGGVAA